MKILLSGIIIMLSFLYLSTVNAASNGTVTISGNIKDNTCTVSPASQDFIVNLGDNASKQFFRIGTFSSWVPFSIVFSKCGAAATGVRVGFTGTNDSNESTILANDTGPGMAEGIGIEIMNDAGDRIPLNVSGSLLNYSPLVASVANTLKFRSRMLSTGQPVTAGTVNATATFTLEYQ